MKVYTAKKGTSFKIMIAAMVLLSILFFSYFQYALLILLPVIGLLLWIYFDTYYKIEDEQLHYKSAFLKGKIEIKNIREIHKNKTLWSGIKPAMAKNGLIIKYSRFDEIYFAPENNDELIADLLAINPNIKIQ